MDHVLLIWTDSRNDLMKLLHELNKNAFINKFQLGINWNLRYPKEILRYVEPEVFIRNKNYREKYTENKPDS